MIIKKNKTVKNNETSINELDASTCAIIKTEPTEPESYPLSLENVIHSISINGVETSMINMSSTSINISHNQTSVRCFGGSNQQDIFQNTLFENNEFITTNEVLNSLPVTLIDKQISIENSPDKAQVITSNELQEKSLPNESAKTTLETYVKIENIASSEKGDLVIQNLKIKSVEVQLNSIKNKHNSARLKTVPKNKESNQVAKAVCQSKNFHLAHMLNFVIKEFHMIQIHYNNLSDTVILSRM